MENKLQDLTEKLYRDGLSKGQQEGEALLAKAKEDAQEIVDNAQKQAVKILEDARKDAETLKRNTEAELKMTARQTLVASKQAIENAIVSKTVNAQMAQAFDDVAFVKDLVQTAVKQFNPNAQGGYDVDVILPQNKKDDFLKLIENTASKEIEKGVDVRFDRGIKSGFKIGKHGEGYMITFTEQDFANLFREHLRSNIVELLFGKE